MRRRRMIGRGIGLAAAAGLVLAVALGVPTGRTAAAAMLEAALAALEGVAAVHVTTMIDDGEGTPSLFAGELWAVRDRGTRFEDEHSVAVYDAQAGRRSLLDRATGTVEVTSVQDPMMLRVLLERADATRNVTALHAIALRDEGAVTERRIRRDGRRLLQLEGLDGRGREIVVVLDPDTQRMVQTMAWTVPTGDAPARRIITSFTYPDPASLDSTLFDTVPAEATRVVEPDEIAQARMQCMVMLRDLATMVVTYADEHGVLPKSLDDLAPYADRPMERYAACDVPGGEPAAIVSRLAELEAAMSSKDVLFECRFADSLIRAFGDGHVEVH
ncbi:MAG: hypothetical protein ACYTJ0_13770 [Planctomycetota bacterium]